MSNVSWSIRTVVAADLPQITAIYADAVLHGTASFEIDPPDEAEMRRRHQALAVGGFPYLVATVGVDILGYAYAGPYRPRPAYRSTVEDSIYLARAAQRAGIGTALLAALLAAATEAGFRQMIAVIGDASNEASIGLHRKAGFRAVGTFEKVGFKHGRWLNSMLMQRELGEGDRTPPTR